jgi:hypothetical protein
MFGDVERSSGFLGPTYMTRIGRYSWHTTGMDLIELARTIQADKNRAIAEESLRRRLTTMDSTTAPGKPVTRRILLPHRPSTGALSR